MEAVALHDFEPNNSDELRFHRNQVIKVLSMDEDPGWYLAESNGRTGLVPNNYLRMYDHSWYMQQCSRNNASDILLQRNHLGQFVQPDGAFIVRTSETTPPDFSLSVKYNGNVQHFKVLKDESHRYYLWYDKFDSINKMIDYHRTHSISQNNETMLLVDMVRPLQQQQQQQQQRLPSVTNSNAIINNNNNSTNIDNNGRAMPELVIALYDFTPQDPDELQFKQNDIIRVVGREDESWWKGETRDGRIGVFPYNYVCEHHG